MTAAISDLSRAQLLRDLTTANPLPLAPDTVSRALPDLFRAAAILAGTPVDWWEELSGEERSSVVFLRIPAFLVVAFLAGWGIRYLAVRYLGRDPDVSDPTYARRLVGAIADAVSRGIFPAMILTVILVRITSDDAAITGPFATVLTPHGGQALSHRITILAALVSVSYFVSEVLLALPAGLGLSLESEALVGFGFDLVISIGMLAVLPHRLWQIDEEAARKRGEEDEAPEATRRGHFWTGCAAFSRSLRSPRSSRACPVTATWATT